MLASVHTCSHPTAKQQELRTQAWQTAIMLRRASHNVLGTFQSSLCCTSTCTLAIGSCTIQQQPWPESASGDASQTSFQHYTCVSGDRRRESSTSAAQQRQSGVASCSSSGTGSSAWTSAAFMRGFAGRALGPNARALVDNGVLPSDSPILLHFKKHIDRPQLTHRLMKRPSVVQLRDMVKIYSDVGRGLDPVHVAAALTRLQHLLKTQPSSDLAAAAEAVQLLVPAIESSCGPKTRTLQYRCMLDHSVASLWALAKLPPAIRASAPGHALDLLMSRAVFHEASLYKASPHTIALMLWATSKLSAATGTSTSPSSLPSSPATSSTEPTPARPSQAAIDTLLNRVLSARLSRDFRHRTIFAFLEQSSPDVIAMTSTSLASLGRLSHPLAEAIADEVRYRLTSSHRLALKPFSGADVVGVAQGFAVAGHQDLNTWLFALLALHVTREPLALSNKKVWKPEHLSYLAAAFATAGIKHDQLFEALSKAAQARSEQFRPWALSQLQEAFKGLGYDGPLMSLVADVAKHAGDGIAQQAVK